MHGFLLGLSLNNDFEKFGLLMRKKVFGIEVPPKERPNELDLLPREMWSQVSPKLCGYDSKGNYLAWNDFIVRASQFKDHKQSAWFVLKMKRNLEAVDDLCAYDELNQIKLVSYSPSSLMGKIHIVERFSTLKHLSLDQKSSQDFLSATLIMEEAITSAQLEGAATTRLVAKEMLSTGRKPRDFSEEMIVNNYQLMNYAKSVVDEPLSIELIQKFNMIATQNVCENDHVSGMIRNTPIGVRAGVLSDEVIHEAPNAENLSFLLSKLCDFSNTDHQINGFIHPIVKAIIIHFMIGYIHPFADGNGRTARALFYWFLLKSGYDNFQYISISSLLKSSKSQYARAFVKTETDSFDMTHFIDFNLNIIIKALELFTQYIQNKIDEIQKTRLDIYKSPYFKDFKFQHITIIKKALEDAGREFTVKECQTEFNVSASAARGYLDKLSEFGLLIKHPIKGRLMGYMAPRNLRERLKID